MGKENLLVDEVQVENSPLDHSEDSSDTEHYLKVDPPTSQSENSIQFISDVSVEDGTVVPPGVRIEKVWSIKNSGSCQWPKDCKLVHYGGNLSRSEETFDVPCAKPNEEVEVTAVLHTHGLAQSTTHVGVYQLHTVDGVPFVGDLLWCKLAVKGQAVNDSKSLLNVDAETRTVSGMTLGSDF